MSRTIVIIRHGPTNRLSRWPLKLTKEGRKLARQCAKAIRDHIGDVPFVILTSDVERAIDTGAVMGKVLKAPQEVVSWLHIEPDAPSSSEIEAAFSKCPEGTVLVLVTHEPQIDSMGISDATHCTPFYKEVLV